MIAAEELLIYAKTVWGEARGETISGMVGVAWTIKNRMARSPWPNTVMAVCLQPLQFSAWNPNDPNFKKVLTVPLFSEPFQRAMFVVLGVTLSILPDPTKGADHYHHKSISPRWSLEMTKTVDIGNHVFYNSQE